MNAFGLTRMVLRRSERWVPLVRLLAIAEVAVQAGRHVAKLAPPERARLLALLRRSRGRPGVLTEHERGELAELVARMEPQVLLGTAVKRLSPLPVPRRVVEGGASAVGRALRKAR